MIFGWLNNRAAVCRTTVMNCFVSALLLGTQAGCAQHVEVVPTQIQAFAPWSAESSPHELAAGDEIELKFLLNTELNDKLTIGPDGRATVPLLGAVQAGGRTVAQFKDDLQTLYEPKLRVAQLDVVVRNYGSSRVYVGGEVKSPGVISIPAPVDTLQGVLMAGGMLPTARSDEVVVIRRRADTKPMLRTVNLRRYAGQATAGDDFPLRSGDVVFVPRSGIAELDLFVDQYLNQALPFQKGLSFIVGGSSGL